MASWLQALRDNSYYTYGYLSGRSFFLPRSFTEAYVFAVSKITTLLTVPLPFLSFLALPFFGGTSTTINFLFFYMTWSVFVMTHSPLAVEIYGTLIVRILFFLLPAIGFLLFDSLVPRASRQIKARGTRHLPIMQLDREHLVRVAGVACGNVVLSVLVQAASEVLATRVFHLRSLLRVTTTAPLPWNALKDILTAFVIKGILQYVIHRYVLHAPRTRLSNWHLEWQHSIPLPFSIIAAYDHPANYLLLQWLPAFAPAYLFRFHVLTWHVFLALTSLEDLFLFSGYSVLPSTIMLTGMARRTDAHFEAVRTGKRTGNYGRLGLLDFLCGTTCSGEDDLLDDLATEADKHRVRERAQHAVAGAKDGLELKNRRTENSSPDDTGTGSDEASNNLTSAVSAVRNLRRRAKK